MTPEQAVVERILDISAVTALVSTRVYMLRLPQHSTLPAIRVQVIDDPGAYHLRGPNYPVTSRVQVDVYAAESSGSDPYSAAIAVAEAVDGDGRGPDASGVSGWSGPTGGTTPLRVQLIQRVDRSVEYEADELREVRVRQDYMVTWSR